MSISSSTAAQIRDTISIKRSTSKIFIFESALVMILVGAVSGMRFNNGLIPYIAIAAPTILPIKAPHVPKIRPPVVPPIRVPLRTIGGRTIKSSFRDVSLSIFLTVGK